MASTCNIIISWSLECCSDWQTMVAIDTQHLCPHNRADMPKACDGFLSTEIMLEARFCSTSTIFLQKSFFEFHFTNNYVLLLNNFFLLEDNCFTILCWFLPYINMNQHRYTYVPSLLTLPLIFRPIPPTVGCHRANSHWLSVLHLVMYMFASYSLNSSHPPLPPLCPQVHSLCLCLHYCPANKFNSTIFLYFIGTH